MRILAGSQSRDFTQLGETTCLVVSSALYLSPGSYYFFMEGLAVSVRCICSSTDLTDYSFASITALYIYPCVDPVN